MGRGLCVGDLERHRWGIEAGRSRLFEYCGSALENIPVLLIIAVWLTVTVIAAWLWSWATDEGD
jgi:hypothetical protein